MSNSHAHLFLNASKNSVSSITYLFDFVWPTAAALWNMQWQTKGYRLQVPAASEDELAARFISGSGIKSVNFSRLNQSTWPELQEWFSRLMLSETCALFEGWIKSALDELEVPRSLRIVGRESIDKKIQFPTKFSKGGIAVDGVQKGIIMLNSGSGSSLIRSCFGATLAKSKKNSSAHLEKFLICYRAFKEVRNSLTHHGGLASRGASDAWATYSSETASTLGVKEKPILPPVTAGMPVFLDLRGVVGFSDVVLRLIYTLDAELSFSVHGEKLLEKRWLTTHDGRQTLKAGTAQSHAHLSKLIRQCSLPSPVNLPVLHTHMFNRSLIS